MDAENKTNRKLFMTDMGITAFWNRDPGNCNAQCEHSPAPLKKTCSLLVTKPAGAVIKTEKKFDRRKVAEAE